MALTSEQRVTKSHIAIMRSKQFCMFAGVLSVGKVTFTDDIPTACTNGRDVMYSPSFIKTLDDKELNFVVLHEALHKVYQHMHLWRKLFKENGQLTNMAADYVVNYAIHEADEHSEIAKRPDSALFDLRFKNMTTKQIFDLLKQNGEDGGGSGHDIHDWEGAEGLSDEEIKQTAKEIDQALRQGEIIRSKMQGNKNRHPFFEAVKQAAAIKKISETEPSKWWMDALDDMFRIADEQKPKGSVSAYRLGEFKKTVKKTMKIEQKLSPIMEEFISKLENKQLGVMPIQVSEIKSWE
jgi:hypothetical protein